jgi:hypothetical protein
VIVSRLGLLVPIASLFLSTENPSLLLYKQFLMPRGKPESKREFSKHKALNPNKSIETSEAPRNHKKEQQLTTEQHRI